MAEVTIELGDYVLVFEMSDENNVKSFTVVIYASVKSQDSFFVATSTKDVK